MKLAQQRAELIRGGCLKEAEEFSQIEIEAWKGLEIINSLGFITNDSQSGISKNERAYVTGFIFIEDVRKFLDCLNLWSDKIAFFSPIIEHFVPRSAIPVTKEYTSEGGWSTFTSMSLTYGKNIRRGEMLQQNIPLDTPAIKVTVIDPKWGRAAWSDDGILADIIEALKPTIDRAE